MRFLLMCFFLHRVRTRGCLVSGFLAVEAGESGSATLTPSTFANTDAARNILTPSSQWLKAMHDCIAYQAMCPHSVFVRASPRSDDLPDWQLLRVFPGSLLGFFGFSSRGNQIQGGGVICTNLLPQYEAEIHT